MESAVNFLWEPACYHGICHRLWCIIKFDEGAQQKSADEESRSNFQYRSDSSLTDVMNLFLSSIKHPQVKLCIIYIHVYTPPPPPVNQCSNMTLVAGFCIKLRVACLSPCKCTTQTQCRPCSIWTPLCFVCVCVCSPGSVRLWRRWGYVEVLQSTATPPGRSA